LLLILKNYPASMMVRAAIRIFLYQFLWMMLACKRSVKAYWKGLLGALMLAPKMFRKRSAIQHFTTITPAEFLELIQHSENQIREWHESSSPAGRSRLLQTYFTFF